VTTILEGVKMEFVFPIFNKRIIHKIYKYLKNKKTYGVNKNRDFVMFYLGIHIGLRIGDLLNIQVKNFTNKRYLKIKEQKTKYKKHDYTRDIFINIRVRTIVDEYIQVNNIKEGYLFTSRGTNKKLSRKQAWKIMKDIGKKFNLDNLGTHSLKKTFGYHGLNSTGCSLELLQFIFNHSESEETLKYIGLTQEKEDNFYRKLDI
jgi:integrase